MTLGRVSADQDTASPSILVVEDDEQIAELMRDFLEAEGFRVRLAGSGRETSEQLAHRRPDLVLLDVMLPDESGFEICRRLRQESTMPVLFLSARDSDADKIRGLGLGGDDYIVKSATPAEVVARVKAVLRRASPTGGRQTLSFGELEIDVAAHEIRCEGRQIELTGREFELLRVLVEHPRQVFSRDHLFELVWGSFGDRTAVAGYVARLRQKIEPDPADHGTSSPFGVPATASTRAANETTTDPHPHISARHRPRVTPCASAGRRRCLADRARSPTGRHPAAAEHRRRIRDRPPHPHAGAVNRRELREIA